MKTDLRTNPASEEDYAHFLALASLFEGTFSIDWIQDLTGRKASQVLADAERAVKEGLLIPEGIGAFSFPDPKARRKFQPAHAAEKERFHRQIAGLLIRDLPDSPGKAEAVAFHLLKIANDIEGCRLLLEAAKTHRDKFQNEPALECCAKIIGDLSAREGETADHLFCEAAIEYSKLNTAKNDVKRVLSILEEAILRADKLKNDAYLSILYMNFAKNKWLQSQYKSALAYFDDCLKLARKLNDEKLLQSVDIFKTFLLYWQGLFRDAVLNYEKSLADVEGYPHGRFPLLATMTVGLCYGQIGQVTQGIGMIDSIRRHCLEKGDLGLAAHSGICIGAILLDIGHLDDALLHLAPAVEEARKLKPDWTTIYGELTLAYAYYLKDEKEKCLLHARHFHNLSKQMDVTVRPWPYLMELAWAVEEGRLPAIPDVSLRREVEAMIQGENIFLKGVACRFKALMQKKDNLPRDQILETLERSVEFLEISGHAIEQAKSRLELARLYLLQGDQNQALHAAGPACEVLSSLNERLIPDDLKALLQGTATPYHPFDEILYIMRELESLGSNRDMIQFIIASANRMTGAERGGIFLPAEGRAPGRFVLRASKNLTQDQADLSDFASSIQLIADVFACGEGKVQALRIQDNLDRPDEQIILSSICVPIISKRQTVGALYHDNRLLSNAFNESQLHMLSVLASYAALIIENDHLLKEKEELSRTVERLTAHYEKQKTEHPPARTDEIVGDSPEIRRVLAQIGEIAPTATTVLILGETGVGKELVARAILRNSQRRDQPFITLNCSALSEELIYSELFGHEKGSFTGAVSRHIGRFEKAHGGTLFLDEIGDLPLDMQVRLLRVLETKEFERVGGKETIRSDFRLITATNRNLEQEIKRKAFRSDLFFRINVFPIHVPALRERKKDIPLLVEHFLAQQRQKTGRTARLMTDGDLRELMDYDWPGNVRELKNCIERYVVAGPTSISDLLKSEFQPLAQKRPAVSLQENERRHIEWALERTAGKIHGPGGAAELLDIHPNTLAFRMKKLGIRKRQNPP